MYGATLYIANEIVTLTHCPLLGIVREDVTGMKGSVPGEKWHGESRHAKYSTVDKGQYHLHGHIHSPNGGKSVKILDKQYDVGVVSSKYRPVSQSTIESWISLDKQGKLK
jgi:calcineurin-like phosphoesterase family protein